VKDGMGSWYIWCLWGALGLVALGTPASQFYNVFCADTLKLNMHSIALINTLATVPMLILMLPSGWLIDRFGPRQLWGVFALLYGVATMSAYFWVRNQNTMMAFMILASALNSFTNVALMPMLYAHLPRDKFGQLVSMQSLVMQALIFLSTNAVGQLVSLFHGNYFTLFLYGGSFYLFVPIFVVLLSRAKNPFAGMATALTRKDPSVPEPRVTTRRM
ncbi:MAG: MFS transporter, partial [Desulfobacteraceae bacterium]|nr:MFS transporter [Desulfobacteraceae bacterium]